MLVRKALITAAAPTQRSIPIQTLVAQDRTRKPVLAFLCEEIAQAGIDQIVCVVHPGDEKLYAEALEPFQIRVQLIPQTRPAGYAHAILTAADFLAGEPFLHLVGDHLYVSRPGNNSARGLVEIATAENCAVSLVQPTRETLLTSFGCVGGRRVTGRPGLYKVDSVLEKPTPTEAEQKILVPGMRAGYYLCFFGMHVLTGAVLDILERQLSNAQQPATLSSALAELSRQEQYLAFESNEHRYDIGSRYGLMFAQMALSLSGVDRDEILMQMTEMFLSREMKAGA